jgi:ubiquinone/menaquinone biosynthesis C-methylase UbiE
MIPKRIIKADCESFHVGNSMGNKRTIAKKQGSKTNINSLNYKLFDDWPDRYDQWFRTPLGLLVKQYERDLILDLLQPRPGEKILDAGCGTGVFTLDILSQGSEIIGLDISLPMLRHAWDKIRGKSFYPVLGDMSTLPFHDDSFDKGISITALEFIPDAKRALSELFRVTGKGGIIVVATLNSLSPWATRRMEEARNGHPIFDKAIFRSPDELRFLAPVEGVARTAIHFQKEESPERAVEIEHEGRANEWQTGAFVAVRWVKP